jgi:hypothetical protein
MVFTDKKLTQMNNFNLILLSTLPAIIVGVAVVFVINAFFKEARLRRNEELKAESRKVTLNLQLQAYERITLFIERIAIQQLVMRLSLPGMAGLQLQWEILKTINEEFEHNFSQQIYLSPELWDLVRIAKESVIRQVNVSASALNELSTGEELARLLLKKKTNQETDYLRDALIFLKKEVRLLF